MTVLSFAPREIVYFSQLRKLVLQSRQPEAQEKGNESQGSIWAWKHDGIFICWIPALGKHHATIYLSCPKTSHSSHELNSTFQPSAAPTLPTVEQYLPFTVGRDPSLDTTKEHYLVRTQNKVSHEVSGSPTQSLSRAKLKLRWHMNQVRHQTSSFSKWWMSKIQLLKALVWIIQFWCGTASWKLIWFLLGYPSTKNLRFRNRSGTSGNAMEIFSICGRVAALGYTYFWVLCVCLSIFLASVLVRVLHPCVAHELWKLLRGCNCCALIWWTHLTDGMLFVCLCTLLLWSGCGKHLTGSLVLPFTAAVWMKVECIPQAICSCTCVWKLEREKHLRITQCGFYIRTTSTFYIYSMWNVHSQNSSWNQSLPCLALILHVWLSFRFRSGCRSGRPRNSSRRWCASWLALVDVHSKCCHVGLKSQILRQTKKLTLRVRKCNSPLTFLSVH